MRISGWRVDGFGVLADHRVEDIPPGLSVVHGPNEAGKSTLLDFVRGVLFGFPDRRSRLPMHEPLRGGRHGGALWLEDAEDHRWLLERHAGDRAASLTAPDGRVADEAELRGLLGGADAEVFRSVFAFGLGELASLKTLERDEVRELVFSAGVLGAGRSATRALRSLTERQAAIVRPRQQDAQANGLRRRIAALDDERRTLRAEAGRYPERAHAREALAKETADARQHAAAIRRRLAELDLLDRCWPVVTRQRAARDALHELPAVEGAASRLLAQAATVDQLGRERSGYEERLERRAAQHSQLAGVERSIAAELAAIHLDGELAAALCLDTGPNIRSRVAALNERAPVLHDRAAEAEAELERAREALQRSERARDEHPSATGPLESITSLDARARDVLALRGLLLERDQHLERERAAEQQERLAALTAGGDRRGLASARSLGAVLGLLAAAVAAAALVTRRDHPVAVPILLGIVAAALLAIAFATWVTLGREARPVPRSDGSEADGDLVAGPDPQRLARHVTELAVASRLPVAPSTAEVDAALVRIEAERSERRAVDELERAVREAAVRVADAHRRHANALDALAKHREEESALARALRAPDGSGCDVLAATLVGLDRLADLDAAQRRIQESLAPLEEAVASYESSLAALLVIVNDPDGAGAAVPTLSHEGRRGVASDLDALEIWLAELQADEAKRAMLASEGASCVAELERTLGDGKDAARLRAELDTGDVIGWAAERTLLGDALQTAEADHERLVGAERDAEREIEQALSSTRLAELEIDLAACQEELASALRHYAVLGIARSLLEQTLGRYERDRQPAVVARASALFATVTDGRYVQLVARVDADGGRSQGIDAIASTGERVDSGELSRGTAEQLYLCLRLALAASFAGGAVTLPLVLDDVLVNFDPRRATAVARVIAEVAASHQVLCFTCHSHVVELLCSADPTTRLVDLPGSAR